MSDMAPPSVLTADDIRDKVKKILDSYGVPMAEVLSDIAALGTPDEAATDNIKMLDYLDGVTRVALDYATAKTGNERITADQARFALTGQKPASKEGRDMLKIAGVFTEVLQAYGLGNLKGRWRDFRWLADQALGDTATLQQYRDYFSELCQVHMGKGEIPMRPANAPDDKFDCFGRPILHTYPAPAPLSQEVQDAIAHLDAQVQKIKDDQKARDEEHSMTPKKTENAFDEIKKAGEALAEVVDELSGDTPPVERAGLTPGSADVIEGDIIEEATTPEAAQPLNEALPRDEQDQPAPKTNAEKVAELINAAFPDSSTYYKRDFFKSATGFAAVATAEDEMGSASMFAMLNQAIDEAKTAATNLPTENAPNKATAESGEVSTPAGTVPSKIEPSSGTGNAVAVSTPQSSSVVASGPRGFMMPKPDEWSYMKELAKSVAVSGMYKDINTFDKALVIMMKGYALGVDPMTALDGIYVINGRPYVGAKMMKALLEKSGECIRFDVVGNDDKCTVTCQRKGRPTPNVYTFSWGDAEKGGLTGKDTYQKSRKKMLKWRAIKEAVETDFAELAFGLGVTGDDDDEDEAAA